MGASGGMAPRGVGPLSVCMQGLERNCRPVVVNKCGVSGVGSAAENQPKINGIELRPDRERLQGPEK